jgi:streptogramin lyase
VLGSRDGVNWVPVSQQSGVAFSAGTQLFAVTTAQAYSYFRLVVTNLTGNGATASLRGWILYGIPEALRITSDGRIGVGVANPTAALEVAGDALFNGNVNVTGVLGDTMLTTAPYVTFDGTAAARDRFLAWMQYVTSARYRYKFSPVTLKKNVWWNTNYDAGMYDQISYGTVSGAPGSAAFWGGVLVPDGRVVFVPQNATAIGIFNSATNTYSTVAYTRPTTDAYLGGVLIPDGRVVFVPQNAQMIGIFNPATNVYSTIVAATGANAYSGGVLLPDGRIVFTPSSATTIGIFNPATNTYSTIAYTRPALAAYRSSILLPDGRVLFVPGNATMIGIFNPATNSYTTIAAAISGSDAYLSGVLVPDGRVIFVPGGATAIGIFNPATNVYSTAAYTGQTAYAYIGGVLLSDGRVIFVPYNSTVIGVFNPVTNLYSTISAAPGGNAYIGGVSLPDGRVLLVPNSGLTIGILSGASRPPPELCYHPCFNKM